MCLEKNCCCFSRICFSCRFLFFLFSALSSHKKIYMRLQLPRTVRPSVRLSLHLSVCLSGRLCRLLLQLSETQTRSERRSCRFIAEEHIKGRTRAIKTMRAATLTTTSTATATCAVFKWRLANFMPFIWDRQQQRQRQHSDNNEAHLQLCCHFHCQVGVKFFISHMKGSVGASLPPPRYSLDPPPLIPSGRPCSATKIPTRRDPQCQSQSPLQSPLTWPQNGLNVCRLVFPFPFSHFFHFPVFFFCAFLILFLCFSFAFLLIARVNSRRRKFSLCFSRF